MAQDQNHFDLALHLVAGAVAEAPRTPLDEGLETYNHLLGRERVLTEDQFMALEQIIGRLDPEIVWRPLHKNPRDGSFTDEDLDSLRGGHNVVHWLTTELTGNESFRDADFQGIIGFIRGRLQTRPT